jgi:hypothetical protein
LTDIPNAVIIKNIDEGFFIIVRYLTFLVFLLTKPIWHNTLELAPVEDSNII